MKSFRSLLVTLALASFVLSPMGAFAGTPSPPKTSAIAIDSAGNDATDTTNHAVNVNCIVGCSGGGGGGSSGGTATASAPTYTEGATSQPLSMDLSGNLRTKAVQSGTWNIGSIATLPALATGANVIGGVTVADGSDAALGAKADTAWTSGSGSAIAIMKAVVAALNAALPAGSNTIGAVTQSGTWNVTNISGTITLPTGAATSALQTTINTSLGTINTTLGSPMQATGGTVTANLGTIGTAATAAKQPALGTAGTASSDVLTIQGVASMTPLSVTDTRLPAALGQSTKSGSLPVTLASDQGAISTTPTGASSANVLLSAAASTNATSVKASAGTVKAIQGFNAKATPVYLKLYDKASSPTVGTDTPVKTIYLPASAAFALDFSYTFTNGIAYALTGAAANADTTALVAGDIICLNVDYF